MKLIAWFKRLLHRIVGEAQEFDLKTRVFNAIAFAAFSLCLVSIIFNISIQLPILVNVLNGVTLITCALMYYLSRFRKQKKYLTFPTFIVIFTMTVMVWFFNGGSSGGIIFYLQLLLIGFYIISEKKNRVFFLIVALAAIVTIYCLEYFNPALVVQYPEQEDRIMDLLFSISITMIIAYLTVSVLIDSYDKERFSVQCESREIKTRNETMEKELDMARFMQRRMIPQISPFPNIAFFYAPMDRVGGDYFDFYPMQDDTKLGIFISDVSGHGVSAAFVTSMIKMVTTQICQVTDNPAEIMEYLNDMLNNYTGEKFVTAFYGIYDRISGDLIYCNAGHNPPYLLDSRGVSRIMPSYSCLPLAVMNSEEIREFKKPYHNNKIGLEQGAKVIFYTDGFVEATPIDNEDECFKEEALAKVIAGYSSLPSAMFVDALSKELIKYRKADYFDDDVCIVCLDVE